jgi:hypothetical protein
MWLLLMNATDAQDSLGPAALDQALLTFRECVSHHADDEVPAERGPRARRSASRVATEQARHRVGDGRGHIATHAYLLAGAGHAGHPLCRLSRVGADRKGESARPVRTTASCTVGRPGSSLTMDTVLIAESGSRRTTEHGVGITLLGFEQTAMLVASGPPAPADNSLGVHLLYPD